MIAAAAIGATTIDAIAPIQLLNLSLHPIALLPKTLMNKPTSESINGQVKRSSPSMQVMERVAAVSSAQMVWS
jgi:hypothetical protein